jgi:mannose-6-phosphate isomerase-like protein (cupin superfamily)
MATQVNHIPSEHLPHVAAVSDRAGELSGLAMPQLVEKRWGYELIYINTEDYCMKQLVIRAGKSTSMHFHVHKHETLTVVQGELHLSYKDGISEHVHQAIVPKDNAWVVAPGFQHQLTAGETDLVLIEASTTDNSIDSVRVNL